VGDRAIPATRLEPDQPSLLAATLSGDSVSGRVHRSTGDWIVDASCFLLAAGVGALAFLVVLASGPSAPRWLLIVDLVSGGLACLALWLRRRWPLGVALALLPLVVVSSSAAGPQGIAMFTVAARRRAPAVVLVGVLYTIGAMVFWAARGSKPGPLWLSALVAITVNVLLNAAILGWGMLVGARRQLVLSLRERARRAETEQQLRVEQARRLERERIAREMHDVLAHRISLLSLHAGALEFHPDAPSEEVARAAGVIRESAHQALQDLRRVIWVLRGPSAGAAPEAPQPTLADLPALLRDSRDAGMRVRFDDGLGDLASVPADVGRDAYRVAQEALTNARKHAPACAVVLIVDGAAGSGLSVEVRNRLPASASEPGIPGAGTGIVGLTERVELAGGRLEHGPTGDGHYRLRAWLPWPA
jgi:signal transduction histidine kinase